MRSSLPLIQRFSGSLVFDLQPSGVRIDEHAAQVPSRDFEARFVELSEDMAALRNANIETIRHIVSCRTLGQAKPGGTPVPRQPPAVRPNKPELEATTKDPKRVRLLGVFFVATMPLIFHHMVRPPVRQKNGTPMALSRCGLGEAFLRDKVG
jgi:hypothetical protein